MARFQILYWQDVPSVLQAFADDGTPVKRQLPDWYQQEIDRVAMEQGLVGSDAYLDQFAWRELEARDGTPNEVLDAVESQLVATRDI
jgi:cvfA/B/C family virulence factor